MLLTGVFEVCAVAAAPATVEGAVRIHGSGAPVAGARVRAGSVEVVTEARGAFVLQVEAGTVVVEVTADGHRPLSATFALAPGANERVVLRLVPAIEEVVVVGEARHEVQERVVSVEELRRVPGSFGDPIRALQSLPSVSRTGDLSGELVVRGAEATNTAVYVDGMRVPYLYHLLLGRSVVDPALIEEVSFHPGAVPPRYGNVTQAVVDARLAEGPAAPGLHGTVHADPIDGGASFAADLGANTTLRTAARVGWAAATASGALGLANAASGGGQLPELTFPYADHALRLDHRAGADLWSLSLLGARDVLRYVPAGTSEALEEQAIRDAGYDPFRLVDASFWRARARWTREGAGGATASAWLVGGRDVQQNLVPLLGLFGAGGLQDARATQWNATVGFAARDPLGERVAIAVGGEGVAQPSVWQELATEVEETPPPLEVTPVYAGPYVELPIALGPAARSALAPALRVSVHAFGGPPVVVPEPQLASRVHLSERAALVGFAGMSSQGPKLAELGAGDDRALGVTRALQTSLGVELRLPRGISLDATAYATAMSGIVVRDTRYAIVDRPTDPSNVVWTATTPDGGQEAVVWHGLLHERPVFRSATGRAFGGEILLRMMPRGPQFGWISAAVGRSFRTTSGPDGETTPSDADLPLSLVAVYGLGMPKGWSLSARGQVTSGLPFTPLEPVYAPVFNDPELVDAAWYNHAAVPGAPNSDRYPAYVRFDLRFEKTWVRPRAEWTAYLDVFNVTNHRNPLWATYNWNYTELRRTAWLPIVPALGLAVRY